MQHPRNPLTLENPADYAAWRGQKLAGYPRRAEDLIVEVGDPRRLTATERDAILDRCRRANMAIYVGRTRDDPDKHIPRALAEQFGLHTLDHNPGADEDDITSIAIHADALHQGYIPYTDRPLAWHTDGYYNPPERRIRAFTLHCVRPAAAGGINSLLDPEMLYLLLRDRNPAHIAALTQPDAMTIPPNVVDGAELRAASTGPVFGLDDNGQLATRYTDRRRNIAWKDDPATSAAVTALRDILADPATPAFTARLEPGWGLICNNVLHTRTRFSDGTPPRLLYRGRYYERIGGT
ncbi:MAG: TauD/TfdA family dioxygenase [Thiohalocapsa sp.]|nr:TauD/TfdA family dioxygenase [Thiohalocapsa sp.]MCF7992943.1 TauD/TfdA family dioxygenase [Thiohalocapsa sp.]